MNGIEFYDFLRQYYNQNGQLLYGNFTFCGWLYKKRSTTFSFRFNIKGNNPKAIPQDIIINAWNANHIIDDNWLKENFDVSFHNDCRIRILNFIINEHNHLR